MSISEKAKGGTTCPKLSVLGNYELSNNFCELKKPFIIDGTQGTLAHEHVSTQSMLAREHARYVGTRGHKHTRHVSM